MKKVWIPISHTFSICWILLHFPMLCEIDEETNAFSMWGSIQYDENLMGKKPLCYGKVCVPISEFLPYDGWFCCIFQYYGKSKGKSMHFPYDEIC